MISTRFGLCLLLLGVGSVVQEPVLVKNFQWPGTGWFASSIVHDLDGDGQNELIVATYDVIVYRWNAQNSDYEQVFKVDNDKRVYAGHVVADLENDGTVEVCSGNGQYVNCWEWIDDQLVMKSGWPYDASSGFDNVEVRGMAAGDLDNDGKIEIAVTTTNTGGNADGASRVYVVSYDGQSFQPQNGYSPAWPRYNNLMGGDQDFNCYGHGGYGSFGLNVAIGNLDDNEDDLEVVATYDNHMIQVFKSDGVAVNTAPYFKNRDSTCKDERLSWGQFIRWADAQVEEDHYNLHTGDWPHPSNQEWLQWTASPPNIADIDQDGQNEVVGIPNIEMDVPYDTKAYGLFVLEGNYGNGSRSGMRKAGWEEIPRGNYPIKVDGWYPPGGVPLPTIVDISGDEKLEIIALFNDGFIRCYDSSANELWRTDFTHGQDIMYASEVMVADLDKDCIPELLFTTFGDPNMNAGYLMILDTQGAVLFDILLPNPNANVNGNGNGSPGGPGIGDIDGDGELEIIVTTFEHGLDIFSVPGSDGECLPWPTGRGSRLRQGYSPKGESATDEPATDEPATDEPATDEPATDEPVTDAPATDEPATDEPATDEPATDEPATDEPATDEPATEEPATDEPATDEPATDEPATDEPATDEPATDEPATDEPATDEPATDEPATDEPATDEPATDEPTDEPTNEPTYNNANEQSDEQNDEQSDEQNDEQSDEQNDEQSDEQSDDQDAYCDDDTSISEGCSTELSACADDDSCAAARNDEGLVEDALKCIDDGDPEECALDLNVDANSAIKDVVNCVVQLCNVEAVSSTPHMKTPLMLIFGSSIVHLFVYLALL